MLKPLKIYFCFCCGHRELIRPEDKIVHVTCRVCMTKMEEIKDERKRT